MKIQTNDYAHSVNVFVVKRILEKLCEDGQLNSTNLAMRSGLNYTTCRKYSNLLEILNWIEIKTTPKNIVFNVTDTGRKILENFNQISQTD